MNLLRRILILVYGLALLALVTIALLFPEVLANALLTLGTTSSSARAIVAAVIALAIIVALFLFIRAPRQEELDGLIVKTPGAKADINITSARELILKAVRDVPNVISAEAKLTAPGGKADIDLAVEVAGANINVPNKQREIDRALRQVALKQLGLQLAAQPRVHIQLVTEAELRAREEAARPLPPPPPVRPEPEPWTPAPVTRIATPVETAPPASPPVMVPPPVVEPAAPMTASAAPEPVMPPVVEEPSASDFVWETPARAAETHAPWGESEPGDGLLVEPGPEAELADREEIIPPVFAEEAEDETLTVPPLESLEPLADEPEPAYEIDASVLDDITPVEEDWLTVNSSPDEPTGLSTEDDEPAKREAGPQSPPMPDLD